MHEAYNTSVRKLKGDLTGLASKLEKYQMHTLVHEYATGNESSDSKCREFLELLRKDRADKQLRVGHEDITRAVLFRSRIVATTLTNSSQDALRVNGAFNLYVLICDESGECLEGEHMIAMTMPSMRATILLGDQEQLAPTVISEHGSNEGALYLKRTLLQRLSEAGYPSTMLIANYRSHPQILDLYNRGLSRKAGGCTGKFHPGPSWKCVGQFHPVTS